MNFCRDRFEKMRLKDICASEKYALNGGPFGSKLVSRDYVDEGVPVIRGVNLPLEARFSFDGFVFVSEAKADELRANTARPGDVVFTQRGTLGQVGLIPEWSPYGRFVISQSQMKLTVDRIKADATYIYYFFRAPETVGRILNLGFSSGVPHINLDILRNFEIDLPPLETQRRIANILSTYDDLIENNTRRIAILEEMAQALYREWFVHFRFPGHEQTKMVESELGLIPEGWRVARLIDSCTVTMGQSPPSEHYNLNGIGLPFHQGVTDFGIRSPIDRVFCTVENRLAYPKNILLSVRAPVGRINIADKKIVIGRGLAALASRTGRNHFVYAQLREFFIEEDNIGNGSIFKAVTKEDVHSILLVVPPNALVDSFESNAAPMSDQIENFITRNNVLRTTRDLLLPALMAGSVRFSADQGD